MPTRFLIIVSLALAPAAWAANACANLTGFTYPGHAVQIRQAQDVAAGALPAHCRVEGVSDARTGRDGKPYGIGFALALPAQWNGRFLFQGGGGLNGRVPPP